MLTSPMATDGTIVAMANTVTNPDGTLTPFLGDIGHRMIPPVEDVVGEQLIDPLFLAQVALAQILGGAPVVIFDGDAWVNRRERKVVSISSIARVVLDWPKSEEDLQGLTVVIKEGPGATTFGDDFSCREPVDVGIPGVIGEYCGEAKVALDVCAVTTHTDERRGLRATVINALICEPASEFLGRTIQVDETGKVVSLSIGRAANLDGEQGAQENRREVVVEVSADVPIIRLTRAPARMVTSTTVTGR